MELQSFAYFSAQDVHEEPLCHASSISQSGFLHNALADSNFGGSCCGQLCLGPLLFLNHCIRSVDNLPDLFCILAGSVH